MEKEMKVKMKKANKNLYKAVSILFVASNLISNCTYAQPIPGIDPFVTSPTWIKQPPQSRWCVRACTDVVLNYLNVLQQAGRIGGVGQIFPPVGPIQINPGVMAKAINDGVSPKITMNFSGIETEITGRLNNNPVFFARRGIHPGHTRAMAFDNISQALKAANGDIIPGVRPGLAILHFEARSIGRNGQQRSVHHACVAYGVDDAGHILVFDPMPGRGPFMVTRQAFRYYAGKAGTARNLVEYCLIQW